MPKELDLTLKYNKIKKTEMGLSFLLYLFVSYCQFQRFGLVVSFQNKLKYLKNCYIFD